MKRCVSIIIAFVIGFSNAFVRPLTSHSSRSTQLFGYDTEFTSENQEVLEGLNLKNTKLTNIVDTPFGPHEIQWKQAALQVFGSVSKDYYASTYETADKRVFHVFFATDHFGRYQLPSEINTSSGYSKNGCKLHYGFASNDQDGDRLYFVVHPNSWGPYQKRFRGILDVSDSEFEAAVLAAGTAAGAGVTAGATALAVYYGYLAAGAAATGPVGWAIGGAAAAGAFIGRDFVDRFSGDYLRYIG